MYRDSTIGVVVPAYNEEGYVRKVVETMPDFVDRVYLVDDCSTDGTLAEIESAVAEKRADDPVDGAFDERWVLIHHEVNRGVGGAITTGYERALEDRVDATAVLAGDAQFNPDILDHVLDPVVSGDVAYAKGSRFLRDDWDAMPRFRVLGNAILTPLTQLASGYRGLTDPQNGYTAISLEALEAVPLETLYEDFGFANDLLVKLNVAGLPIADVERPAAYGYQNWKSHIDYKRFIPRLSALLLRDFVWRLNRRYLVPEFDPVVAEYYGGVATALVGLLGLVAGRRRGDRPSTGPVLFALGALALVHAVLTDRENAPRVERVYLDDDRYERLARETGASPSDGRPVPDAR